MMKPNAFIKDVAVPVVTLIIGIVTAVTGTLVLSLDRSVKSFDAQLKLREAERLDVVEQRQTLQQQMDVRFRIYEAVTHSLESADARKQRVAAALVLAMLEPDDSLRLGLLEILSSEATPEITRERAWQPLRVSKVIRLCSESHLEILLQEFIPGPPTAHHFLDGFMDRHGRIRAVFARRRVRAQYGELSNSSCLVSIDIEPMRDAAENLERFLRDIGYRGMFSAEFKLDPRDGRFKFIEVNTRVWGDMGLALRCGVDVVQMAYKDALGEDVQPVLDYKVGQYWINLHRDRVVARDLIRDRQLTWGAFGRSWMRASFDLLSLSDPGPALWDLGQRLRRRAGTELAQLGGRRAQQHVGAL
jgi:hypothetical protein